jgi:hypothetical protein
MEPFKIDWLLFRDRSLSQIRLIDDAVMFVCFLRDSMLKRLADCRCSKSGLQSPSDRLATEVGNFGHRLSQLVSFELTIMKDISNYTLATKNLDQNSL